MSNWDWKFPEYSSNWAAISEAVKKRDGYKCRACGALGHKAGGTATLHADHIVPKSKGGTDNLNNLRTLCVSCHASAKGHSHMRANPQFKQEIKKSRKKFTF